MARSSFMLRSASVAQLQRLFASLAGFRAAAHAPGLELWQIGFI
jgi:hypothetical protein